MSGIHHYRGNHHRRLTGLAGVTARLAAVITAGLLAAVIAAGLLAAVIAAGLLAAMIAAGLAVVAAGLVGLTRLPGMGQLTGQRLNLKFFLVLQDLFNAAADIRQLHSPVA